jgi:hypothetical protein
MRSGRPCGIIRFGSQHAKAAEDCAHSKSFATPGAFEDRASVMHCGHPLPLLLGVARAGPLRWPNAFRTVRQCALSAPSSSDHRTEGQSLVLLSTDFANPVRAGESKNAGHSIRFNCRVQSAMSRQSRTGESRQCDTTLKAYE